MQIDITPVLGGTAHRHATRTAEKLAGFALRWVDSIGSSSMARRYLDVGRGNGFITELVAPTWTKWSTETWRRRQWKASERTLGIDRSSR